MAHAIEKETEAQLIQEVIANKFEDLTPVNGLLDVTEEHFNFLRSDRVSQETRPTRIPSETKTFAIPSFTAPGGAGELV